MTNYGWRTMVDREGSSFFRDEVRVFIAHRVPDGLQVAEPLTLKLSDPIPLEASEVPSMEPTILPRELAEALLNTLGHVLLGHGDMVSEICRLRHALATSERRVDQLIAGIGRLGGKVNGD